MRLRSTAGALPLSIESALICVVPLRLSQYKREDDQDDEESAGQRPDALEVADDIRIIGVEFGTASTAAGGRTGPCLNRPGGGGSGALRRCRR